MKRIITVDEASEISRELKKQNKKIVLAGGCFDIIHIGHIKLFEEAKKKGDSLFILLESDENISQYKGAERPINNQQNRAHILSVIRPIDYVVLLPPLQSNDAYDKVILALKPDIIATTIGDPYRFHKERQAQATDAKVIDVTPRVTDASTSRLASILEKEL